MAIELTQEIISFKQWRSLVTETVSKYRDWLTKTHTVDSIQDLRLYDIEESLKRDFLVIAFVGEFSRGKTELINALFFADYNQRLLPSDAGRTTMCPAEIMFDEREETCIKLLPIETRQTNDSFTFLKSKPSLWTKIRLNIDSADAMQQGLQELVQRKEVSIDMAKKLGLWDDSDEMMIASARATGQVEVPVWRHAVINYPHPLLKSGLIILDTPGLNTLGAEPELTINILSNAHAVIFLLATDTGVTKSDMDIWMQFIRPRGNHKLAVLNKIDILWDELKTDAEIAKSIQMQVDNTAKQLNLKPESVFAISAQKALLAKIKKDSTLLEKSGIARVEASLATQVLPQKYAILRSSFISEVNLMLKASRKTIQKRQIVTQRQLSDFQSLKGKNKDVVQSLLTKVTSDRKHYEDSVNSFSKSNLKITAMGGQLLKLLSPENLNSLMAHYKQEIGDSWTTRGLIGGMNNLARVTTDLARQVHAQEAEIKQLVIELYAMFHEKHGFEKLSPPDLRIEQFVPRINMLEALTKEFCSNPVNMMTEKHFLIRKFFVGLAAQMQEIYSDAYTEAQKWMHEVSAPLRQQMIEHKADLEKRIVSLMRVHHNLDTLQKNMQDLELELSSITRQTNELDSITLNLLQSGKSSLANLATFKPATEETLGMASL